MLIEAAAPLPVRVVIVGDGPMADAWKRAGGNACRRVPISSSPGRLPDDEVKAWLRAADILVLPSISPAEAFGVVQLEAMASAIPVVSTRVASGVPWVNKDEETGLVVAPGDAGALRARPRASPGRPVAARAPWRRRAGARPVGVHPDGHGGASRRALSDRCGDGAMKRMFDAALASIGLALSAPVSLVCASLIKLEDGGPVFYAQERVGLGGRTFRALKFRSMRPDAEETDRTASGAGWRRTRDAHRPCHARDGHG